MSVIDVVQDSQSLNFIRHIQLSASSLLTDYVQSRTSSSLKAALAASVRREYTCSLSAVSNSPMRHLVRGPHPLNL